MNKKNFRIAVSTFIVGILLGLSTAAYAATATSINGYYGPVLGYSYLNNATVSDNLRVWADAWVETTGSAAVPTGYMGVQARLFKNDALYASTSMSYNSSSAYGISNVTQGGQSFPSGTYYSKGVTAAYTGTGYSTYSTFQSPSINH